MTPVGKPLLQFRTREEFLIAFRDAFKRVCAEKYLEKDKLPSGILIDFDHSIRISDTKSPYSKKTKIGTYSFMSHNVHQATPPSMTSSLSSTSLPSYTPSSTHPAKDTVGYRIQ